MDIKWVWPLKKSFISKITDERVYPWWSPHFLMSKQNKQETKMEGPFNCPFHLLSYTPFLPAPLPFPKEEPIYSPGTMGLLSSDFHKFSLLALWKPQTNSLERLKGESAVIDSSVSGQRKFDRVCSMNLTFFIWSASRHDDFRLPCSTVMRLKQDRR